MNWEKRKKNTSDTKGYREAMYSAEPNFDFLRTPKLYSYFKYNMDFSMRTQVVPVLSEAPHLVCQLYCAITSAQCWIWHPSTPTSQANKVAATRPPTEKKKCVVN